MPPLPWLRYRQASGSSVSPYADEGGPSLTSTNSCRLWNRETIESSPDAAELAFARPATRRQAVVRTLPGRARSQRSRPFLLIPFPGFGAGTASVQPLPRALRQPHATQRDTPLPLQLAPTGAALAALLPPTNPLDSAPDRPLGNLSAYRHAYHCEGSRMDFHAGFVRSAC